MMQQYFVEVLHHDVDNLVILGQDAYHMIKVMRMRVGESVRIVLNQELAAFYEITQIDVKGQMVYLQKQAIDQTIRELPVDVTVVLGLLKSDKFDYAVQKLTELGVETIIPWQAARSIVKMDDQNEAKKRKRWQMIAKEAAEQSQRLRVPVIQQPKNLTTILAERSRDEYIYVAYEGLVGKRPNHLLDFHAPNNKVTFIIGPEGGISSEEVAALEALHTEKEIHFITLGNRILRAETAAIFAMSLVAGSTEHLM